MNKIFVYMVSDGTGISVETLGQTLTTLFPQLSFEATVFRFIDTEEKASSIIRQIQEQMAESQQVPIIFSTMMNAKIRQQFQTLNVLCLDFIQAFIQPLEKALGQAASQEVGRSHAVRDDQMYGARIDAVNFALANDDGQLVDNYGQADVILIGISRTGKTPTCLYLAMRYGLKAANFPLTPETFSYGQLPDCLRKYRHKVFGLTVDSHRLVSIREKRRPNSQYASLSQCEEEIRITERMYKHENLKFLNASTLSIEELATQIISQAGLKTR